MKVEQRAQQVWQIITGAARNWQILTYGMLGERIGMPAVGVRGPLHSIMDYCACKDLPPLTVIVVNAETGLPGSGLTTLDDLPTDREAVFRYNWDALLPPSASDFAAHAMPTDAAGPGQGESPYAEPGLPSPAASLSIASLWVSKNEHDWIRALERYEQYLKPSDVELVKELEPLDLAVLKALDARGWYEWLRDKYFRWKYTAPNRLATTRKSLAWYDTNEELDRLFAIKNELLSLDTDDMAGGLKAAGKIKGLGAAGASGLLALMYPKKFATVDQFVVKALREVPGLPEAELVGQLNPERLKDKDGEVLIKIMRRKADENNRLFRTDFWTPKRIDEILWTYGR